MRFNVEERSESLLKSYLQPALSGFTIHAGFSGDTVKERPCIAIICPDVKETVPGSSVFTATMAIEVRTRIAKDADKASISAIIDAVRTALQIKGITAALDAVDPSTRVHGVVLAEAQTEPEGQDRVWTQALDIIWSHRDEQ